jgi:hypothetical protein
MPISRRFEKRCKILRRNHEDIQLQRAQHPHIYVQMQGFERP